MKTETDTHVHLWFDIGFAAEMQFSDGLVNFIVFRIVGRKDGRLLYQLDGEDLDSTTEDRDKAVPFFEGEMEVSGRVNGEVNQEPMLVQFCTMEHVYRFNCMTVRLYRAAAQLLFDSLTPQEEGVNYGEEKKAKRH